MKFSLTDEIPHPLDLVFKTHRDHLLDFVDHLPNVARIQILKADWEGNVLHSQKLWTGSDAGIPGIVRPMIKPEMLTWKDTATWDGDRHQVDWHLDLNVLPGALSARGTNRFEDAGQDTVIHIEGEFTLIPEKVTMVPTALVRRLAPLLERFVVGQVTPNYRTTNEAVARYIEENLL